MGQSKSKHAGVMPHLQPQPDELILTTPPKQPLPAEYKNKIGGPLLLELPNGEPTVPSPSSAKYHSPKTLNEAAENSDLDSMAQSPRVAYTPRGKHQNQGGFGKPEKNGNATNAKKSTHSKSTSSSTLPPPSAADLVITLPTSSSSATSTSSSAAAPTSDNDRRRHLPHGSVPPIQPANGPTANVAQPPATERAVSTITIPINNKSKHSASATNFVTPVVLLNQSEKQPQPHPPLQPQQPIQRSATPNPSTLIAASIAGSSSSRRNSISQTRTIQVGPSRRNSVDLGQTINTSELLFTSRSNSFSLDTESTTKKNDSSLTNSLQNSATSSATTSKEVSPIKEADLIQPLPQLVKSQPQSVSSSIPVVTQAKQTSTSSSSSTAAVTKSPRTVRAASLPPLPVALLQMPRVPAGPAAPAVQQSSVPPVPTRPTAVFKKTGSERHMQIPRSSSAMNLASPPGPPPSKNVQSHSQPSLPPPVPTHRSMSSLSIGRTQSLTAFSNATGGLSLSASNSPPVFADTFVWQTAVDPFTPSNSASLVFSPAFPEAQRSLLLAMDVPSILAPTRPQLDLLWAYACCLGGRAQEGFLSKTRLYYLAAEIHARLWMTCVRQLKQEDGATKWKEIQKALQRERPFLLPAPITKRTASMTTLSSSSGLDTSDSSSSSSMTGGLTLPSTIHPQQLAHLKTTVLLLLKWMDLNSDGRISRQEFNTTWTNVAQQFFGPGKTGGSGSGTKNKAVGVISCAIM